MTLKYTTEQIITLLECATEEGSILQIDMQDFQDELSLCGSSPMCFNVTGDDTDELTNASRDATKSIGKNQVAAAVVVCGLSYTADGYSLVHIKDIFEVFRKAVGESAFLVFGVGYDPSMKKSIRVTWLAGAPDR